MSRKKRIIVGMSGGVDSSVAAWLLKKDNYEVTGIFMKNWDDPDDEFCTTRKDFIDAVSVAEIIGIDIDVVDFSKQYREKVFKNFLSEYKAGRTPNPDVLCNSEIKFQAFLQHALDLGADMIATGHYAKIRERNGLYELLKGEDGQYDQSYFLYRLKQSQLAKSKFPLGNMRKTDVRNLAKDIGLPNYQKKTSTGLCFVGERPFRDFLEKYVKPEPGDIVNLKGDIIGEHKGLMFHTIGQRQGLGIGGPGDPWYVIEKNTSNNQIVVAQGETNQRLYSNCLVAEQLNWISGDIPKTKWVYGAKTRYRQQDAHCAIEKVSTKSCKIQFAEPQRAITVGQSVVVYESMVCLGGGIIESTNQGKQNGI